MVLERIYFPRLGPSFRRDIEFGLPRDPQTRYPRDCVKPQRRIRTGRS